MRYSILLASALAVGALARPQPRRRTPVLVTETEVVTTTIVVYVTEDYVEPSSTSIYTPTIASVQSTSAATSASPSLSPSPSPSTISPTEVTPTQVATPAAEHLAPASFIQIIISSTQVPEPPLEPKPVLQPGPESQSGPRPEASSTSTTQEPQPTVAALLNNHVSGPEQAYLSAGSEYQAAMLYHHNAARANHNAEPLTWDTECEANARIAAKKCLFEHYIPQGADQGQNLFTVSGDAFNATAGVTTSWYQGELEPMMPWFGKPDVPEEIFHRVGHLTQLVWKATTKVGCVSLDCGGSMIVGGASSSMNKYTICNYAPAGNMGGEYAVNVAAPISSNNLGGWAN
ncbi:PR-1-like protein [Plenodomus tracheiphilus IPT5]|uniref:PR-1-like protein n=1 Tax=Plenodomus tracheiphilus IPT5 TaxID=1408161 RepID=A0A6A7BKF3_9PLEO|nr:PR-1-like protein [Plenodomus tracheiphilus IPT5]